MTAIHPSVSDGPADGPAPAGRIGDDRADELRLVRALTAGDAAAGEALVRRLERPLAGYLRRLAGSGAAAEELFQQTWLAALENLGRFDAEASGANFKAWLFRIATNKAHDRFRRGGRDRRLAEAARDRPRPEPAAADERAVAGEEADRVREALDTLPDAQREVVLLRYYGGLKFAEIAEMTGCPINTALGRMHKAAKKLRVALGGAGERRGR